MEKEMRLVWATAIFLLVTTSLELWYQETRVKESKQIKTECLQPCGNSSVIYKNCRNDN